MLLRHDELWGLQYPIYPGRCAEYRRCCLFGTKQLKWRTTALHGNDAQRSLQRYCLATTFMGSIEPLMPPMCFIIGYTALRYGVQTVRFRSGPSSTIININLSSWPQCHTTTALRVAPYNNHASSIHHSSSSHSEELRTDVLSLSGADTPLNIAK